LIPELVSHKGRTRIIHKFQYTPVTVA